MSTSSVTDSTDRKPPTDQELPCARLVQITDPHLLKDPDDAHRTVNTSRTLERVLNHAQAFLHRADAVLLTGDIAQDEEAATYARLRDSWSERWVGRDTEVWCLPGNHDAPVLMQAELNTPPFSCLGHHALGNWEVILLDTRNPGLASGLLGPQELTRLKTRLAQSTATNVLVATHHHPLPLGRSWLDKVGLADRDEFEHVLSQDERVKTVVFGHIHHLVDRTVNGIRYLGCPSTGVQFTPNQIEFGLDKRPPGFRTLTLYPSGQIRTQVIWVRDKAIPHRVGIEQEIAQQENS